MRHIANYIFTLNLLILSVLEISGQGSGAIYNSKYSQNDQLKELTMADFKTIATGFNSIQSMDGYYYFQRFPSEALEVFKTISRYVRAEATSGVRLRFRSDTRLLVIDAKVLENSPQTEPFIILCNDSLLFELPSGGVAGDFEQILELPGKGEKTIEICFPAYSKGSIRKLQIEKNSTLKPLKRRGIYLAMGNSITQQGGRYMGYADIVARGLDLDLHEAGVGGHVFDAESVPFAYIEKPVLITLAYGTNDWNGARPVENASKFLDKITLLYPSTPIFMLEPIRRYVPVAKDGKKLASNKEGISLMNYRKELRSIAKNYPSVRVINYKKLMPDDPSFFEDGVHPTEKGHIVFGENLLRILKKNFTDYAN